MEATPTTTSYWRALLVLGRVSNLPTVWTNCLAGWWLGGAGHIVSLVLLCIGATFVYIGGMYLNDACDTEFDRKYRTERPIPSGVISASEVWTWAIGYLVIGTGMMVALGADTAVYTVLLLLCVIVYDVIHKQFAHAPVIMAGCRFFLLLAAASIGDEGVTGLAAWSAVVLAAYIVGLSYLARQESTPGLLRFWPCILLAAPLVLAWIVNDGDYRGMGILFSVCLIGWVARSLWYSYYLRPPRIGKTISGLLAGIVLVDLLAILGGTLPVMIAMVVLFVAALIFQKYIPAT